MAMAKWLETLASAPRPPIWLDDTAYTTRLLAGGRAPWLDVAACIGWRRKVLQLLEPAIEVLDVAACVAAWIAARADLHERMRAKREPPEPLRVVLADEALQNHIVELARASRASTTKPLALVCPAPRRWLIDTFRVAFNGALDPDADETDDAASYCASFLRAFGGAAIDALLLRGEEAPQRLNATAASSDAAAGPLPDAEWACYGSLVNLARHYRWDLGWRVAGAAGSILAGADFLIASSGGAGVAIDAAFWSGAAPPALPSGSFAYAKIPAAADPASVLERLRVLR
jgi:hypothetical protein